MENLESKPITALSEPAALQEQFESLRHLVVSMLVLVIVLSAALNIYLWRQVKYTRADLSAYRPQAAKLVADFERFSQPAMQDFAAKLNEFGRNARDENFNAILKKYEKYGLISSAATSAPPPVSPAIPAAKPPKK